MRRNDCPACSGDDVIPKYNIRSYRILQCEECETLFVENVPSEDALSAIYADKQYYSMSGGALRRIASENERRIAELRRLGLRGNLLDVGCASGAFLDAAREAGFSTTGIEQSEHTSAEARARGHKVFVGRLQELASSIGQHDVVVSLDVIEHVPEPYAFVTLLKECLKPSGMLVISTPNYSGAISRLLGEKDPFFIPPEHLNFFSRLGLERLGTRAGLTVCETRTFGQLLEEEFARGVKKFVPWSDRFPNSLAVSPVNTLFAVLNRLKLGLELELYFRNARSL